jgi:hypothetical protein
LLGIWRGASFACESATGFCRPSYGEGVADRIRAASGGKVDAFIDTFGGGYVDLTLELGVAPDRIYTIIDFAAAAKHGVKTEGNSAAANAKVLAELASLIDTGRLESRSPRSIIWPMYARPIRISRGVIAAVRSCSCPDGWLREINGSGTAERGCTDRSPIELTRSVSHGERALLAIRGLPQVQARLEALNPGIANAAGRIGKHGTTRPDDPASVFADIRARCDPE